jgi:hypothetical protein
VYQGLRLFVKWTENVIVYNEYEIIQYAHNEYEITQYAHNECEIIQYAHNECEITQYAHNEYEIIQYAHDYYEIIRYVTVVVLVKALAQNSPQNLKTVVPISGT